jgi:very-short-patch-repair endonuclease
MIKERPTKPRIQKIKRICKYCSDKFEIYPSWGKNGQGIFCSRSCRASYHIRKASLISPTSIERLLIDELNSRNIKYEFQYQISSWVIDFAIPERRLAIEADGVYWHGLPNVQEKDARKDKDLRQRGWNIIHFTGDEIRKSIWAG